MVASSCFRSDVHNGPTSSSCNLRCYCNVVLKLASWPGLEGVAEKRLD